MDFATDKSIECQTSIIKYNPQSKMICIELSKTNEANLSLCHKHLVLPSSAKGCSSQVPTLDEQKMPRDDNFDTVVNETMTSMNETCPWCAMRIPTCTVLYLHSSSTIGWCSLQLSALPPHNQHILFQMRIETPTWSEISKPRMRLLIVM